jgi:hypothetical protein
MSQSLGLSILAFALSVVASGSTLESRATENSAAITHSPTGVSCPKRLGPLIFKSSTDATSEIFSCDYDVEGKLAAAVHFYIFKRTGSGNAGSYQFVSFLPDDVAGQVRVLDRVMVCGIAIVEGFASLDDLGGSPAETRAWATLHTEWLIGARVIARRGARGKASEPIEDFLCTASGTASRH